MTLLSREKRSEAATKQVAARSSADGLKIGEPHDGFEQEADRVAEEVMGGGRTRLAWSLSKMDNSAPLQRKCDCGGECDDCKKDKTLQRETNTGASPVMAPPVVHDVLSGSGQQMGASIRQFMEAGFGYDFSRVRIFNDDEAARSARAVSANAYTVGDKIVFNRDRYTPNSQSGRRLLAHELAHVVQQDGEPRQFLQRDSDEEEDVPRRSKSVLQRAFDAADAKQWEVAAARLANGLSPFDMKIFLSQYKDPELISYLHKGALGAEGVGGKSAIALATEATYKEVKHKEEVRYRRQLAQQNGAPMPPEEGTAAESQPQPKPLSVQERKKRCESGETKGLMVFPLRLPRGLWRISAAPISAERSGKDVVVRQPVNAVLGDKMFNREVKTLPLQTFLGGVHLAPDDIVKVRLYDDNERVICVTGEQMLKMSQATDTAILLSIAGTVLDAASVFAPGATQALASRGLSTATAGLVVGGTNIALNEGLEVARQTSAVNYGLQDRIQWGQIAFETLLQAVTLGFGSRLTNAAVNRVAKVATGTYSRAALQVGVETVLQGSIAVIQSAARSLFNRLQGEKRNITVGGFLEELAGEFAQGVLFHLIMQAVPEPQAGAHSEQKRGVGPAPAHEHSAPAKTHIGSEGQPVHGSSTTHQEAPKPAHDPAHVAAKPGKREPETGETVRAVHKEEALAVKPTEDGHEAVVTKRGVGKCSDPPCPVIHVVYAKELEANPELKRWNEAVQNLRKSDPAKAAEEGKKLIDALEHVRSSGGKVAPQAASEQRRTALGARIAEAEGGLNPARQATIDYQAQRKAAGRSLKGGPIKGIWNVKERIWILKRQRAFPDRTMLEQARIVGIKAPDGKLQPASDIAATGRIPDFIELRGSTVVAGDLKSTEEFKKSIEGGLKKPGKIEGEFRTGSKVGGQHEVEKKLLDSAKKSGGKIVIEGANVLTGETQRIEVEPQNYMSEVLTYEEVLPN